MFDFSLLKGLMVQKGFTQKKLAKAIDISSNSLSCKLNGKSHFSAEETCQICELLGISSIDIGKYFFAQKV